MYAVQQYMSLSTQSPNDIVEFNDTITYNIQQMREMLQ